MKILKATCYAVWTVLGVVSLVVTAVYVWMFKDTFKMMKNLY